MPTRGYAHRIDVRAPRERVWRALIEPAPLAQWYGPEARVAPRANGSYRIRVDVDLVREAHIDVFEPGRRLRLIYMPQPQMPPTDSVIVDDFMLDVDTQLTTLRLLGFTSLEEIRGESVEQNNPTPAIVFVGTLIASLLFLALIIRP